MEGGFGKYNFEAQRVDDVGGDFVKNCCYLNKKFVARILFVKRFLFLWSFEGANGDYDGKV